MSAAQLAWLVTSLILSAQANETVLTQFSQQSQHSLLRHGFVLLTLHFYSCSGTNYQTNWVNTEYICCMYGRHRKYVFTQKWTSQNLHSNFSPTSLELRSNFAWPWIQLCVWTLVQLRSNSIKLCSSFDRTLLKVWLNFVQNLSSTIFSSTNHLTSAGSSENGENGGLSWRHKMGRWWANNSTLYLELRKASMRSLPGPITLSWSGEFGTKALDLFTKIGTWIHTATQKVRVWAFFLKQVSIALQGGNAASVLGSMGSAHSQCMQTWLLVSGLRWWLLLFIYFYLWFLINSCKNFLLL